MQTINSIFLVQYLFILSTSEQLALKWLTDNGGDPTHVEHVLAGGRR